MQALFYPLIIRFYGFSIRIASLFNSKAKQWIDGRKGIFESIKKSIKTDDNIIWFHAASLGEFEQGRPLIEQLKEKNPENKILLTFFSPSGYEVRNNYDKADYIFYLPLDTKYNAKRFLSLVKPKAVFFIKYEFWRNYIYEIHRNNIPLYLISGIFREDQVFFKWYGKSYRNVLEKFRHLFVQNEKSQELLNSININSSSIAGDTRFDRVKEIADSVIQDEKIINFIDNKKLIIAGSSWEADEKLLFEYFKNTDKNFKLIIAPHDIKGANIARLIKSVNKPSIKYSELNENNGKNKDLLIIDNIGMLSSLYSYSDFAYIGGGFGAGIHNILEAAVYGQAVIFGPKFQKFDEAKEMVKTGSAFSINNYADLAEIFNKLLTDQSFLKEKSERADKFVKANLGSVDFILKQVSI